MNKVISVRLTGFVSQRIEPDPNNISKLMNGLNNLGQIIYMPSIIASQTIELPANKINVTNNLSFVSTDNKSRIIFVDNRIDYESKVDLSTEQELKDTLNSKVSILAYILEACTILSNRLAVNIDILANEAEGNVSNAKNVQNITAGFDFYEKNEVREYLHRLVARKQININGQSEEINVVTEINLALNLENKKGQLLLRLGINTIQENQGYRFNKDNLAEFMTGIMPIIQEIQNGFDNSSNS